MALLKTLLRVPNVSIPRLLSSPQQKHFDKNHKLSF